MANMTMRREQKIISNPNLFIVGAPKCGTTSLAAWLAEHPNIYMSTPKEPEYFDHDRKKGYSDDLDRYESYFSGVNQQHLVVGEASTGYLRSRVAVAEILKYSPDAKFIVGIRNPVDMAASWHGQAIFEAWENVYDFEKAWRLQDSRNAGGRGAVMCPDIGNLLYGEVCKLGAQLERLMSQVSTDRIFIYSLDEMRESPRELWLRLLTFLGVPDDGRNAFKALNEAKSVPAILRIATRLVVLLKRNLGLRKYSLGLLNRLNKGAAKRKSVEISAQFKAELVEYFRDDVVLLSNLAGHDYSTAWFGNSRPHDAADQKQISKSAVHN